jgi:hypothetical protein
LEAEGKALKEAYDTANKAFNQVAKQKMKVENERAAKEEEKQKAKRFQEAKDKVAKAAKNI